jgi:hypothetical protein
MKVTTTNTMPILNRIQARHPGRHRGRAHDREFRALGELRHRVDGAEQGGDRHHAVHVTGHQQQHVEQRVLDHVAALAHRRQLAGQVHEGGQGQEGHQHEATAWAMLTKK